MSKKLRIVFIAAFAAVFVFAMYKIIATKLEYKKGEDIYENAIESFVTVLPESTPAEPEPQKPTEKPAETETPLTAEPETKLEIPDNSPGIEVDFAALKAINDDIIGWLYIPNTDISYPLLSGVDNDRYLRRTYNNTYSSFGSIFVDKENEDDFSDDHTIIYGHNMKNGSMFGHLSKFNSQEYVDAHRYVYILTDGGWMKYEIFSTHQATTTGGVFVRKFGSESEKEAYYSFIKRSSWTKSELVPTVEDKVITLSTCTSVHVNDRFVVHAMLIESSADEITE